MHQILVSNTAEKALKSIPKNDRIRVINAIKSLALHPFPQGSRKLVGEEATFRIRVGDYRIIYEIEGRQLTILVLKIGHRKDIYR